MHDNTILLSIFLIFTGAAVLSTVALYTRQSLLVAYILLGVIIGPWGLKLVSNSEVIAESGDIGIIFLLFMLGLHLQPQSLWHLLRQVSWVALVSSVVFFVMGYGVASAFGFAQLECLIVGAATMFSSTIIGLKLLPTAILHHQHTGELMMGVLLMQDLLAIIVLLLLHGAEAGGLSGQEWMLISIAFPVLLLIAFLFERFVLRLLLKRFSRVLEYMFLLSIGWCLSLTEIAAQMGLSAEIGAFLAGVTIASSPISLYIAENLKPVRDFFLVMFFFSVGASFNFHYLPAIIVPAVCLFALIMLVKPLVFRVLLRQVSETRQIAWEVGVRLSQGSEFSLLLAYLAAQAGLISQQGSYLIQAAAIFSFIASSYWVVWKYPTPLGGAEKMRRD